MKCAIALGMALVGVCGACETGVKPVAGSAGPSVTGARGDQEPRRASGDAPGAPDGFAATVNGRCPVMPKQVLSAFTAVEHTVQFEGRTVGFCCDDCPETWKVMTDAERRDALARVARAR